MTHDAAPAAAAVAHALTLASLVLSAALSVTAIPQHSSSSSNSSTTKTSSTDPPKLYVCRSGQCVLSTTKTGLPLSQCEVVCAPPAQPANYTCSNNQCEATNGGLPGLPKAQCDDICGEKNVLGLIKSRPDLSTLFTAITATPLKAEFGLRAPLTFFAPTNAAFAALPPATVKSLLDPANVKQLAAILQYHAHGGVPTGPGTESSKALHTDNFTNHQLLKTLEGENLTITLPTDGTIFVNHAQVIDPNHAASNGVVHIIDKVLMPLEPPGNHLYFRNIDSQGFCGQVDAGPRMPPALFGPNNKQYLRSYIDATLAFDWAGHLELGLCSQAGYAKAATCPFQQPIQWAPEGLMRPVCEIKCSCNFPDCCTSPGSCRDNAKAGKFCSLCGPKFNAPINIQCYTFG